MVLKSALNSKPIIEFAFYKMLIHTLTVLMVFIFACKEVVRPWPDQPVRLLRLWFGLPVIRKKKIDILRDFLWKPSISRMVSHQGYHCNASGTYIPKDVNFALMGQKTLYGFYPAQPL